VYLSVEHAKAIILRTINPSAAFVVALLSNGLTLKAAEKQFALGGSNPRAQISPSMSLPWNAGVD